MKGFRSIARVVAVVVVAGAAVEGYGEPAGPNPPIVGQRAEPALSPTIAGVSDEFQGSGWDLAAVHLVDGSGLSGNPPVHAMVVYPGGHSWQTGTQTGTGWVTFGLGATTRLTGVHVWNLNFYPPYNGRGGNQVLIESSVDGVDWQNLGVHGFEIATGADGDPGFEIDTAGWPDLNYLRLSILSNFGSSDNAGHVGLSEVRMEGVAVDKIARPTWEWTSGGGGNGTFRYRLDEDIARDAPVETTETSFTPGTPLADGPHTLYVQERDDGGNWSGSGSWTITVGPASGGMEGVAIY